MDNYEAAEPIPDPAMYSGQYAELMDFLHDNNDMRKAAKSSVKQGLFAGTGAVAGGLVLGPLGGLIGGIAGSIIGFVQSEDYDGVVQQVLQLDQQQQQHLVKEISMVLTHAGANARQFESPEAFRAALMEFAQQPRVREQLWRACVTSIE